VRVNKIYRFMSVPRGTLKGGGENAIIGEIFELICTYLNFTGTNSVPTNHGPSKFFKICPL